MSPKPLFTLGRQERLKSRKLIERLFEEGKSFSIFPFRVYYMFTESGEAPLKAGFTAGSRHFKRAVHRNRIKRVTKEAYRLQKQALEEILHSRGLHLILFFIYTSKELPENNLAAEKISVALQRLISIVHERDPSTT